MSTEKYSFVSCTENHRMIGNSGSCLFGEEPDDIHIKLKVLVTEIIVLQLYLIPSLLEVDEINFLNNAQSYLFVGLILFARGQVS